MTSEWRIWTINLLVEQAQKKVISSSTIDSQTFTIAWMAYKLDKE